MSARMTSRTPLALVGLASTQLAAAGNAVTKRSTAGRSNSY